jgi:transcriptional regulator with GAF, ATPase, and Fis domain
MEPPQAAKFLVGRSEQAQRLLENIRISAPGRDPVLIRGESGSGKELVAKEIYAWSDRATGPLVICNCASLPEGIADSALFGAMKGAFTGAVTGGGHFSEADRGTLFLDEIGDLPLAVQPKLLRAIQFGTVRAVGGPEREVDVRVIAATNLDLPELVRGGRFRMELLARFAEVIEVPPLRERPEDIPDLLAHFLLGSARYHVAPGVLDVFASRRWDGNVRELELAVRRAVKRAAAVGREELQLDDFKLDAEGPEDPDPRAAYEPLMALARSVIADLDAGRLGPATIPELAARDPRLDFRWCLATAFREREWESPADAALRLFGYNDPDAVNALLRRKQSARRGPRSGGEGESA